MPTSTIISMMSQKFVIKCKTEVDQLWKDYTNINILSYRSALKTSRLFLLWEQLSYTVRMSTDLQNSALI